MNIVSSRFFYPLLLGSLSLILLSCEEKKAIAPLQPLEVPTLTVSTRSVPRIVEFVGTTKGAVDAEVRARVSGVIQGLHFKEGTQVQEGDLLYSIDPAPYKAKVAEADARVAEARTRFTKAASDLKRIKPLAAINAVSKRELDGTVAQEAAAQSAIDAASAALEAAQIQLSYTEVRAPVSGMISLSKAKVGEFVGQAPNPVVLATVSQLDPIHVRFAVSEKDFIFFSRQKQKEIATGEPTEKRKIELVFTDGSVHPYPGVVESADSSISPETGALSVDAEFPNPNKLVRPGQYAKVRAVAEIFDNAILLPKRAIKDLQGQFQVFVVGSDGVAHSRQISLGAEINGEYLVTSGLAEGERVVADGLARVKDGALLKVSLGTSSGK